MAQPVITAVALLALLVPQATAVGDATVQHASVSPDRAFTDSVEGVRIEFRISASAPADVTIGISGSGHEVRSIDLMSVQTGDDRTVTWDGLDKGGLPVADGTYHVVVKVGGGGQKNAGEVTLRRHFFPVRGPHGTRGGG